MLESAADRFDVGTGFTIKTGLKDALKIKLFTDICMAGW